MGQQAPITPVNLSDVSTIDTLTEHRKVYNLNVCELNIYETFHPAKNVVLSYDGLVISSMMRGKKRMSLNGKTEFDFLPGESVILPKGVTMNVGFPEASETNPVQCATLALNTEAVNQNLQFLNEHYGYSNQGAAWKLNFQQYHFENNKELASCINRMISISMEKSPEKNALADMALKFLLMRVIQTQNLAVINQYKINHNNLSPAIRHIHENLSENINIEYLAKLCGLSRAGFYRSFKERFGITPLDYLTKCRIDFSKKIMADPSLNISDICYSSGFNNLNYFIRTFKKIEGVTPKMYRSTH